MEKTNICDKYLTFYDDLKNLVIEIRGKIICDEPEEFVLNNINFFTKSFMVISCAYLESYLKDICFEMVANVNSKLVNYALPNNLVRWSVLKSKEKDKEQKIGCFKLNISKEDIDDELSGNVSKTISMFIKLGIDLLENSEFNNYKDKIASIVNKRNNIVHHNDEATDVSINDVISNIDILKVYITSIDYAVNQRYNLKV